MEYTIESIEPTHEGVRNRYYSQIVGRKCDIIDLQEGRSAVLLIDVPYDEEHPHRFCTTNVLKIRTLGEKALFFETENSVYALIRNVKE